MDITTNSTLLERSNVARGRASTTFDGAAPGLDSHELQWAPCRLPVAEEWAVAHVHSRAEKAFVRCLHSWGVPCYLPQIGRCRYYGARRRQSYTPLFPGYVFFDSAATERARVFDTKKVANIIYTPDQERLREELASLCTALAGDVLLRECRFGQEGSQVVVVRGPLRGVEGVLVRYQGKDRLVLQVKLLGRAVLADVDIGMCEPA